jgi:histidine triad (HIT) family protein
MDNLPNPNTPRQSLWACLKNTWREAWFRVLRGLARVARPLTKRLLGFTFAHLSFALPVKRLAETGTLLAFHHPRPSYNTHILLVSKMAVADLVELDQDWRDTFLMELFKVVQELEVELGLDKRAYKIVLNGGAYQDIPHLHIHLISQV